MKLKNPDLKDREIYAATFGWLCVETLVMHGDVHGAGQPPSGGCVLKLFATTTEHGYRGSHLRVAVC